MEKYQPVFTHNFKKEYQKLIHDGRHKHADFDQIFQILLNGDPIPKNIRIIN
jgi:mRNA-degrading endonuclease YafQ of YafQ-DinJ toxin-antitoxin module